MNKNSSSIYAFKKPHAFSVALVLIMLAVILLVVSLIETKPAFAGTAGAPYASAQINCSGGATMRKKPTTDSKRVVTVDDNTGITVMKEIFLKENSSKKNTRWYYVKSGSKTGYIRADLLDNFSYSPLTGNVNEAVNYRTGAGTGFKKKGSLSAGQTVEVRLGVRAAGTDVVWFKVAINGKAYYLSSEYVTVSGSSAVSSSTNGSASSGNWSQVASLASTSSSKSDVANALLAKATSGGSARTVYTFSTSNCSKAFSVTGYNKINTPQGMTFTGDKYYILYGDNVGQRICTYSADGKRITATNFSSNVGHPNGITWDPITGLCYIFKGNQYKIYTWNPTNNKFGSSKTPYSSSGVGYDSINKVCYASSQTGIRIYSADGNWSHIKLFSRCKHSSYRYIQDCCGYGGIVFHCVSGKDKKNVNYIDVYRATDYTYLGSIKVTIGEVESCIVDNNGTLKMLVNTSGNTDYVWNTPLNVNQLVY